MSEDEIPGLKRENIPFDSFKRQKTCMADRFVPMRRNSNLHAMNYRLTKIPPPSGDPNDLDIFEQIASLETTWRKDLMKNAIHRADVIPGLTDRRVLNFMDRENRQPIVDTMEEQGWAHEWWKTKTRNKPLLDRSCCTIKLRRSGTPWTGSFDWGAHNLMAAIVDVSPRFAAVALFDVKVNNYATISAPVHHINDIHRPHCIKWNHAGDKIAVTTDYSKLKIYTIELKLYWSHPCPCTLGSKRFCDVAGVIWTHSDEEVVTFCSNCRISSYTNSGELIQSTIPESDMSIILSILFSHDDRYFIISSSRGIGVYTWPSLIPFLNICADPEDDDNFISLAWNPWNTNILCIGGCPDDTSLSLWDIHRQEFLECKRATAMSRIENLTWNKLSGELVVNWSYWKNDEICSLIVVLASLDRVVDVFLSQRNCFTCPVWNPDNTLLAIRRRGAIKIWKFFGDEAKKWKSLEEEKEKRRKLDLLEHRRTIMADQTIHLDHYTIR